MDEGNVGRFGKKETPHATDGRNPPAMRLQQSPIALRHRADIFSFNRNPGIHTHQGKSFHRSHDLSASIEGQNPMYP